MKRNGNIWIAQAPFQVCLKASLWTKLIVLVIFICRRRMNLLGVELIFNGNVYYIVTFEILNRINFLLGRDPHVVTR